LISAYQEIHTKISELLIDGKICSVLTRSFGDAVKTVSYISEKLNIPFIPFSIVDNLLDKRKMKAVLKKGGILTPKMALHTDKKTQIPFPLIVKPSIGHAKSDVKLITNSAEMKSYIKNFDSGGDKVILVEEYIKGDEVIALGLVVQGKFHLVEITDKELSDLPYFIDIKHITPSIHLDKWDAIASIGQSIADAFSLETTPLLIEMRITDNGKIYVIETASEFGGEFLADYLIPARSGYDIMKNAIKANAGLDFQIPSNKKSRTPVVVQYLTSRKGILSSFDPINSKSYSDLIFYKIFKGIGSEINSPKTNLDRFGVVICKGKTRQLALDNAEKIISLLNIRITGKNK
jgi:biotin carboxylase